jgi:DNA-binding PadR family transcriptional regulator
LTGSEIPRLSATEFVVMNLLVSSRGEMYGLQLVEESDGKLKRGTIYVTLGRLEEKGYISSRREADGPGAASARSPRRLYKPTGLGAKVFRALAGAGGRAWLREALA